jgi:hypothetical protein
MLPKAASTTNARNTLSSGGLGWNLRRACWVVWSSSAAAAWGSSGLSLPVMVSLSGVWFICSSPIELYGVKSTV